MYWNNFMIQKKKSKTLMINKLYNTMLSYCLKCKNNTESENPKVVRSKNTEE